LKSNRYPLPEASENPERQFLDLAERLASVYRDMGLSVKATRNGEPVEFRRAKLPTRQRAIAYLAFNIELIEETMAAGGSIKDSRVYLWRALKKLRLTPPADILSFIDDDDIVEIYYLDEFQIFRNMRFIEITSFTIDEMLFRPWYRNVSRGPLPQMRMAATVLKGTMGLIRETVSWNVPPHAAKEKNTLGMHSFQMQLKHFIPLRQDGKVVAFISTNNSTLT
jgi:hypothetical protein